MAAVLLLSIVIHDKALAQSDSLQFQQLISRSNDTLKVHPYVALEYAAQARQLAELSCDSLQMALAYKTLGNCYYKTRVYYLAMNMHFKAFEIYARLGNRGLMAECFVSIATTYMAQEVFDMAEEYCMKAIEICKSGEFPEVQADAFAVLGMVSIFTNEELALPNMKKAKQLYDSLDLVNKSIDINIHLAEAYSLLDEPDSALNLLEHNLEKYVLYGEKGNIARTYLTFGNLYELLGELSRAATYYTTSIKQFTECGMMHEAIGCRLRLATVKFNAKDYDVALQNATKALELAQIEECMHGTEEIIYKHNACQIIYRVHQVLGHNDLALKYCERFAQTGDSVYILKKQERFSEFQVSMESQRLQKEIEMIQVNSDREKLLFEKKQYNRNVLFLSIIITLVIAVVIIYIYRYKEKERHNTALSLSNNRMEQEIKERKIAEAELRNSEEKYRLLFRKTPVGIIQFNDKFVITAVNERFMDIFSIKNKNILGQDIYTVIPQKTFEGFSIDGDGESSRAGKVSKRELKINTPGGEVYASITFTTYLYNTGNDVEKGGILIIEDITERKKAEEHRNIHNAASNNIIDMMPESIFLLDEKANYIFARIPGLPDNEQNAYIGRNMREMLTPDILLPYLVAFNTVRKTGETQYAEYELENNPDVENEARFIRCDDGKVLVTVRDISRQKRAEKKLKNDKNNAESGSKAKSEFILGMTTEFKAPLETILMNCEQLAATATTKEQGAKIKEVINSALFVNETFTDILKLTEVETVTKNVYTKLVDPISVAKEVFEIFRSRAEEKKLEYNFVAGNNIPKHLHLDEVRMRQILFNIISNGIKFTENGSVTLTVNATTANNKADITFAVTDTGVGISDAKLKNIFSPENGNTGMVLTKKMADSMGASITVKSEQGKGSTFLLLIKGVNLESEPNNAAQKLSDLPEQKHTVSTRRKNSDAMREYVSVLKYAMIPEFKNMKNQMSFEVLTDVVTRFREQSLAYHIDKGVHIADELIVNINNYDIPNITMNLRKLETYIQNNVKDLQGE